MLGRWRALALAAALTGLCSVPTTAAEEAPSVERGARLFAKCRSCHQIGAKARHAVGPHLNDLFGRRAGTLKEFAYSGSMRVAGLEHEIIWDEHTLDHFLRQPKELIPATRMAFRGMDHDQDRADLIAFLHEYSTGPQNIPEAPPLAYPLHDPEVPAATLAIVGDVAYGEYLSAECVTCHQTSGEDKGIPSIVGWPSSAFVRAMHAYKVKHRQHPVMQMVAGNLEDDEIASLAAYFETLGK